MNDTALLHPGIHAARAPTKPAIIVGDTGAITTFAQLEALSNKVAHLLRGAGCVRGSHIAIMMENCALYLAITWAAQRAGLYYTPINWHLKPEEAAYVVNDCGAQTFLTSQALHRLATTMKPHLHGVKTLFASGSVPGFESLEPSLKSMPEKPIADECEGSPMLYSSGTTGFPKGIKRPLAGHPLGTFSIVDKLTRRFYGFGEDTQYLSPGPLYHSAPLNYAMSAIRQGGTAVVMESFEAEQALALIERYRINRAMFVPTHFNRMLSLPDSVRTRYDVSSIRYAIHAAAPCPIPIKEAMLAWWGPVIYEYYAGSEGNGFCMISPEEWMAHKGSVGKPVLGPIHILDLDTLAPQQRGAQGLVYFEGGAPFEYHNAPEKTRDAFHPNGWSTLGDIGYLDKEGYLYLTDRKSHTIISGGVNIYPQEVENCLAVHPDIADVAVIGVPNADFGEEVKAIVQLKKPADASDEKAADIIAYARNTIAHLKCPRSVDFVEELPRLANGKLLKRNLKAKYWS